MIKKSESRSEERQADHDAREVGGGDRVENEEDALVVEVFHTEPQTHREHGNQNVQVEEERGPRRRLVLHEHYFLLFFR